MAHRWLGFLLSLLLVGELLLSFSDFNMDLLSFYVMSRFDDSLCTVIVLEDDKPEAS